VTQVPASSHGGGGNTTAQVVASGKVLPVAAAAGVTVDTTTYDDTVKGSGKMATLVFPAEQAALGIAQTADAFPRLVLSSDASDYGLNFSDGSVDPNGVSGAGLSWASARRLYLLGHLTLSQGAANVGDAVQMQQVSPLFTIASGALPTAALVSGAASVLSASRDVEAHTPVTFNPGVATTATCTIELSPDNVTYSTLAVVTKPVGTVFDGEIEDIIVRVPATWRIRLTVVNATLGTTTYY
jgi:hypothetical protein